MKNSFIYLIGSLVLLIFLAGCVEQPEPVDERFPLSTGEKMSSYVDEVMGFQCVEGKEYTNEFDSELLADEHGYYGRIGYIMQDGVKKIGSYSLVIECLDPLTPTSSQTVYRLIIDPNNGFVYYQACYDDVAQGTCPKDADGKVIYFEKEYSDDPNYLEYISLDVN